MTVALAILVLLIVLNGFFAASEIALVSLNESKVERQAESGDNKAKKVYDLITEPSRFLSTIQIGITLAGFLASAFAADFFADPIAQGLQDMGVPLSPSILQTIAVIGTTIVLSYFTLVFGELVPKQLALQKSEPIANFAATPLTWLFKTCLPLVKFLSFSTNTTVKLFGVDPNAENEEATEEDIRLMVDDGGKRGTIQQAEKLMINNIFEFNDKTVSDIITHRTEVSALAVDATLRETVQLVNSERYTRFPVYEGDMDHVIGLLHSKDLIQFLDSEDKSTFYLKDIIRNPYFVVETQNLDVIFREMQQNNMHIAIVLDEYGGTEGLITIEDIIEEIVGDIFSEHVGLEIMKEEEEIKQVGENKFAILGTIHLHEVEDSLDMELPTSDFDTLSGFLIGKLGYFPQAGEQPKIHYGNVIFEVNEITPKRIERVTATIVEQTDDDIKSE
ncbi:hemolysin family protein [Virgibacillus siamensis]|uniref:hemolysin family protein n=1 Tax=Virgibacillus siamensis TaxID=480071 RepID=UPI0009878512|nr:hemolysin family protein [Virgibacillus siamensis]